jgi:hypothetical protein
VAQVSPLAHQRGDGSRPNHYLPKIIQSLLVVRKRGPVKVHGGESLSGLSVDKGPDRIRVAIYTGKQAHMPFRDRTGHAEGRLRGHTIAERTKSLMIFGANSYHSMPKPSLNLRDTCALITAVREDGGGNGMLISMRL